MKHKSSDFCTVTEFAQLFGVHPHTIYKAIASGRIQAFRVGSGKRATFRIMASEVERMLAFDAMEIVEKIVYRRIMKDRETRKDGSNQ